MNAIDSTPSKSRAPATRTPGAASPARPSTPARRLPGSTAAATASPQIRAALAALRKNRASESVASPATAASSEVSTPATPSREADAHSQDGHTALGSQEDAVQPAVVSPDRDEVLLEWNVASEDKLVEAARKTGRLNLASHSLTRVPASIYSSLLPRSSFYHPANRDPARYRLESQPDLSMAAAGDDERGPAWYEQRDLLSLNLANNELEEVEDEMGGFEELEVLDLHNNSLPTLPVSLGYLVNLTTLSIAHNRLSSFPLQLLNLKHLRDLSLAHNRISTLWAADWHSQLAQVLKPPESSPSATPESTSGRDVLSYLDSVPSSPTNRARQDGGPEVYRTAPFPSLATLVLAGNPLAENALSQIGFEFPPRLTALDLSTCGLTESALPPGVFGSLRKLKELDLSANEIGDNIFSPIFFPSSTTAAGSSPPSRLFPSLEKLDLSLNPIDSLETFETFLHRDVRRPTAYVGLPHILDNLVRNEERRNGRRLGVCDTADVPDELESCTKEVQVVVRECPMALEQQRRRAKFTPTATSVGRETAAGPDSDPATKPPRARGFVPGPSRSPSPPPSPSPASAATSSSPGTPARRRPVVLEDWEIEAAAGLSTPGARRRAAALKAQAERAEREQRLAQAQADADARARQEKAELQRREAQPETELVKRMETVDLANRHREVPPSACRETPPTTLQAEASDAGLPPPYSPRDAPAVPSVEPAQPASAGTSLPEADATDPAVEMIASVLTRGPTKSAVVLSGRSLTALPVPTTRTVPAALSSPSHAELGRNLLPVFPLAALAAWGWGASLRVLSLANNRIAAFEVLAMTSTTNGPVFPSLDTLDLSSNFLPSHIPSPLPASATVPSPLASDMNGTVPLLAAVAALCPTLSTLSLRANRLTDLSGISAMLLLSESSRLGTGVKGVRRLDLGENRIRAVDDLCQAAELFEAKRTIAPSSWRCEELDLSMNDIGTLPPKLGLLPPTLVLHLIGNSFRLPRKDVYENAGERLVIPWLRDRL